MNFLKRVFMRVCGWLAIPVTYAMTKAVELVAPVVSRINGQPIVLTAKNYLSFIIGVLISSLVVTVMMTFVALVTTALTLMFSVILPVVVANLIGFVAASAWMYTVVIMAVDRMPNEIAVEVKSAV
jgi:hypothetical protein